MSAKTEVDEVVVGSKVFAAGLSFGPFEASKLGFRVAFDMASEVVMWLTR